MPRAKKVETVETVEPAKPQWTPEQLRAVKGLGPGVIGQAMYEAAQKFIHETNDGMFGPAILGIIPDAYKDQRTLTKPSGAA